jgi:hypothetical protein
MARAIGRALGDRVISEIAPAERDRAGKRLAMEVEFAGRPEPLVGRTLAECAERVAPGLDGVALRRGGERPTWAVRFPSRLQSTNTGGDPARSLIALLVDAGLPAKDLPELARLEPVGLFRFPSLRIAQSTPEGLPSLRGRGVPRVVDATVTPASVQAHILAGIRRFARTLPPPARAPDGGGEARPPLGVAGTYSPVADEFRPLVAPPQDQAIVAWAAAMAASSGSLDAVTREEALQLARTVLSDLTFVQPSEDSPLATIPSMAFVAMATEAIEASGQGETLGAELLEFGSLAREKLAGSLSGVSDLDRPVLLAAAAASLGTDRRFLPDREVRRELNRAWTAAPKDQLIGAYPWLMLAESRLNEISGEASPHLEDAKTIAKMLFGAQAGFGDLVQEADLAGGFRLTGAGRGGVTAQGLRPGIGLLAMTAFPGWLDVQDRRAYRDRLIPFLRFVQELAIDEDMAKFFRNGTRAVGGTRAALWDSDLPVPANALAIVAGVLALESKLWEGPPAVEQVTPAP